MSALQHHSVQKYAFDIHYDSEKEAIRFQNELLSFIRDELLQVSDEVFSEMSSDIYYRISRLELDLGVIDKDKYSSEVKDRLKSQLREKLQLLIFNSRVNHDGVKAEQIAPLALEWEAFCYFMEYGILPWSSYKSDTSFSFNSLLENVMSHHSSELKMLMEQHVSDSAFLSRMAIQWNDDKKWLVLSWWIEEDKRTFLQLLFNDLIRIYSVRKIAVNYLSEYKELIWIFLFQEVIRKSSGTFSEKMVFGKFIEYLSIRMSEPKEAVIFLFKSILFISDKSSTIQHFVPNNSLSLVPELKDLNPAFEKFIKEYDTIDPVFKSNNREEAAPGEPDEIIEDFENVTQASLRNESEQQRTQRLEKRKQLLIRLLTAVAAYEGKKIHPATEILDQLIREYDEVVPSGLKAIFRDLAISLEQYNTFNLLEKLPESLRVFILEKVFEKEYREYATLKEKISLKFFLFLVESDVRVASFSLLVKDRKEWSTLVDRVLTQEKSQIVEKLRSIPITKAYTFVQLLKETLYKETLKKHSIFFEQAEEQFNPERKSSDKYTPVSLSGKNFRLSEISHHEHVYLILVYLREKKLPDNYQFTIEELLALFTEKEEKEALVFFHSLKTKDRNVLLPFTTQSFRSFYSESRKRQEETIDSIVEEFTKAEKEDLIELENQSTDQVYNPKKIQEGEPVYVNNAGLVIFHPYLSRFFKVLNLMDKKGFKDEHSAHKAAHILQYLASKSTSTEEHELFLNKILCGIEPETPLMREIEITEEDKATCENLIEGVIANWPILKKTSNDNFRASFLLREGKLVLEPQGWKLRVEERA